MGEIPGQARNDVGPGMRKGEPWAYARLSLARLGERNGAETCRETCWSTAGGTKWGRNVPRDVLEHGWGNRNGLKRNRRRAERFLHSLALGRNDKGPASVEMTR